MTNDLRIADAPLLVDVSGEEKLPTGGYGNYSTTINQIADFTQLKWKLATEGYVNNEISVVTNRLNTHAQDKTNPHGVTKEQVGLGEVDNTADLDKPVSAYQQSAIDEKIAKTSIVDNLTTNESNKVLSAKQGKILQDNKAEKKAVTEALDLKANKSDVYSKDEVYTKTEILTLEHEDKYVITESGRTQREKNNENLSLFDFKAVDSTTVDSTEAVRAYHSWCNTNNKPATYAGFKNLAIKDSANIIVYTDFDISGCEIVPINQGSTSRATMYIVRDPSTPLEETTVDLLSANLALNSRNPTKGVWENTGFCSIESTKQMCDRDNVATTNYIQPFWMIRGEALKPLHSDLSAYNIGIKLKTRKSPKNRLAIKNLCLRDNGFDRLCLINVQRNKVDIDGFSIQDSTSRATGTIDQLITFQSCGDISLSNFTAEGRPYSTSGTYGIRMDYCSKVRFNNVQGLNGIQNSTWGVTGSNYISDVVITNSNLSRFDVHACGFDISYLGGTLADGSLLIGSGGGVFKVGGGCNVSRAPAFNCRTDYGNQYENCTIIVDDIVWQPLTNDIAQNQALVNLGGGREMGGKVAITMPNIKISNVVPISNTGDVLQETCYFLSVRTKKDSIVYVPAYISISNIALPFRMRWGMNVDFASLEREGANVTTTRLDLHNINGTAAGSYTSGINGTGVTDRPTPSKTATTQISLSVTANNVYPMGLYFGTIIPASVTINNAKITHAYCSTTTALEYAIRNSSFYGNSSYTVIGQVMGTGTATNRTGIIQNCYIPSGNANYSLSSARILSGVYTNATDTLPAGATRATAFTGWTRDTLS